MCSVLIMQRINVVCLYIQRLNFVYDTTDFNPRVRSNTNFSLINERCNFCDWLTVGHCHPYVVEAGSRQMAQLSTNNRFLHDNLGLLAEKLVSMLPSPLSVCYLVNSG